MFLTKGTLVTFAGVAAAAYTSPYILGPLFGALPNGFPTVMVPLIAAAYYTLIIVLLHMAF